MSSPLAGPLVPALAGLLVLPFACTPPLAFAARTVLALFSWLGAAPLAPQCLPLPSASGSRFTRTIVKTCRGLLRGLQAKLLEVPARIMQQYDHTRCLAHSCTNVPDRERHSQDKHCDVHYAYSTVIGFANDTSDTTEGSVPDHGDA
jgi:hypothetical protein